MTMYNRVGTCNRCGLCCGAPKPAFLDKYPRRTPFPKNWPYALRGFSQEEVDQNAPHLSMANISRFLEQNQQGTIKLKGQDFPWCVILGVGIVTDTSPNNDGSSYDPQCPFLKDQEPDLTRPCGLVGSRGEPAFTSWCEQEPTFPRSEKLMQEWVDRFGEGCTDGTYCSYSWEAIP